MALAANKPAIVQQLLKERFVVQRRDGDLFFVRDSDQAHLFERIEFMFVGHNEEAAVLSISIAAVRSIQVQFAGLIERDGIHGLDTDPDNGRVELTPDEVSPWLERLGELAPGSVRALAHERGGELLRRTQSARAVAQQAYVQFVEPALARGLGAIVETLTEKQREAVANMSSRPLVIGSEELEKEYEAALAALTLAGDATILELGQAAVPVAWGHACIKQVNQVPDEVMWKIRILVDMILGKRSEATLN